MSQLTCLRCKAAIDAGVDQCPHCGEKVTVFQRTYADRLLDGKYQILDRLGVGGMGEIFKVRHIHLNELRVIKIMRPNVASDDQGLQRFLQEARTSTMIKHRNLAMLYDFAQLEDGSYYMVWEFIDGTNIQKWIASNGPIPPRLAIEISIQALTGLEHLHQMELIHRDISPENIMLSQDNKGKLLCKVIDFGIAKQLAEGEGGHGLTQTGMFLGKLKYASPEQAGFLKEGEHLDPRSDLYSFGIVLYEMLAGRAPFQATNPHGYILKHVTEKPAPIAETNPGTPIPEKLEAIVMKSLEKNRDNRFESAGEFAKELEAIREGIAPDKKYGLGEKMVTLSGAQTLADLQKVPTGFAPTMSGAAPTQQTAMGARAAGPTGTRAGGDDATVMERGMASPQRGGGSNEATVLERVGTANAAAPTVVEQKWASDGAAEATVLERQLASQPQKKPTLLWVGIAAVLVLVIGIAAFFMTRKSESVPVATTPAGTAVTATAPVAAAMPDGQGLLLLSATPWGEIEKIVAVKDQKEVALVEEYRSTPARIPLDPGEYSVTVSGPGPGSKREIKVQIEAGKRNPQQIDLGKVDFDALEREIQQ